MRKCSVKGCNTKHGCKGYCYKHYQRFKRHGDPTYLKEKQEQHGKAGSFEYRVWCGIKKRCLNNKDYNYKYYGAKGITICDEWQLFSNFYADMGKAPTEKHSIDRIDGTKGYSPDNCRWATRIQQNRNRRAFTTYDGKPTSSKHRGVKFHKRSKKWTATIGVNGKRKNLGYFDKEQDAVNARKAAEKKYWSRP